MKHPDYLLELTADEARALGYSIVDRLLAYQARLSELPVVRSKTPQELRSALWEPLPPLPQAPDAVLDRVEREIFSSTNHETHPRFFAFIPGPSNFVGPLAEFLRTGYNIFAGSWLEGSGPAVVELVTLDWIRKLAGYPEMASGTFLSGGSLANLSAIVTARDALLAPQDYHRAIIYGSDQTHSSILRAMRILGFQKEQFHKLPSDSAFRLPASSLSAAIQADHAAGKLPFCVIGNAGTTNTGAIDPLHSLAEVCEQEKLWLHADGAYGAAAIFCERGRALLRGLERADSFTLDPHKWLFQPFDCAVLLVRDRQNLRHAFHVRDDEAEYLQDARGNAEEINLWDYSPELTRPFRALKLWMSLQIFGAQAFAAAMDRNFYLAEFAEKQLLTDSLWEVTTPAQMAVLTFRAAPQEWKSTTADADAKNRLDSLNRAIAARMQGEAFALVLSTELRGQTVLRLCTINPRTTEEDITRTLASLAENARRAMAELSRAAG
jgi:aromatic-L-amino-acid/L-tryptophan decarboxylase